MYDRILVVGYIHIRDWKNWKKYKYEIINLIYYNTVSFIFFLNTFLRLW